MEQSDEWDSDWASPPGDTIRDILEECNIPINDFAYFMGINPKCAKLLIIGKIRIDEISAKRLDELFGPSKEFWIKRESQYREDLKRINKT